MDFSSDAGVIKYRSYLVLTINHSDAQCLNALKVIIFVRLAALFLDLQIFRFKAVSCHVPWFPDSQSILRGDCAVSPDHKVQEIQGTRTTPWEPHQCKHCLGNCPACSLSASCANRTNANRALPHQLFSRFLYWKRRVWQNMLTMSSPRWTLSDKATLSEIFGVK